MILVWLGLAIGGYNKAETMYEAIHTKANYNQFSVRASIQAAYPDGKYIPEWWECYGCDGIGDECIGYMDP